MQFLYKNMCLAFLKAMFLNLEQRSRTTSKMWWSVWNYSQLDTYIHNFIHADLEFMEDLVPIYGIHRSRRPQV